MFVKSAFSEHSTNITRELSSRCNRSSRRNCVPVFTNTRSGYLKARYVAPAASVRKIDVKGGLLLLNEATGCLFAYNDTAGFIWNLIEKRSAGRQLARAVARQWKIPAARALADVQTIVAEWRHHGLLAGGATRLSVCADPVVDIDGCQTGGLERAVNWTCRFGEKVLEFVCDHEPIEPLRTLLKHQEHGVARVAHARIAIKRTARGRFIVECNGVPRICTADLALLQGAVWQMILETVHQNSEWLALIHGAAVSRDQQGIALSAPSGSGKSTLTAGLIKNGFTYLADDLIAIPANSGKILPFPLPLSIKAGSRSVVARQGWDFAEATKYRTKDLDAYLLLPPTPNWQANPVPLRALVFPRFIEFSQTYC